MKYSDILFEKTCVSLYIQKHCTVYTMLQGDQRGCKQCKKGRDRGHKSTAGKLITCHLVAALPGSRHRGSGKCTGSLRTDSGVFE